MGHDVVGVRVAAVLVVRGDHLRPERADLRTSRPAALSTSSRAKQPSGSGGSGSPSGRPGVDEAEPLLLDAEDLAGLVHLLLAHLVDVLLDVRVALELRVEDGAALAARAGHDQHVHPLGHVLGHGGRALARLVVGVGVHGHQSQLLSQDSILSDWAPDVGAVGSRGDFYSDRTGGRKIPGSLRAPGAGPLRGTIMTAARDAAARGPLRPLRGPARRPQAQDRRRGARRRCCSA